MAEEVNYRQLLQGIETTLYDGVDVDPAAFLGLLQAARPAFLNLLRYKEPSAESRAAVQSGRPNTPAGPVVLDPEPDVREVLLLADELKLDELLAVLCVQAALEETGEVSAAAGAGVYFEERRGLLASLWLLLQAQVMSTESLPSELYAAICDFNADLLAAAGSDGRSLLLKRLAELVRYNSLEAPAGSRLPSVLDTHGRVVDRNVLVAREQTLLCECLLYACCIQQRQRPADIIELLDVLHRLSLRARSGGGGGGDVLAAQQQAYSVLAAALCCLLPLENAEGAEREADDRLLRELAASRELDSKVASFPPEDSYLAVVRLAWGSLLSEFGGENAAGRASALMQGATENGALAFLREGVMGSVPMQDEPDHQRELHAQLLHQLLMAYLSCKAGRESVEKLSERSEAQAQDELDASAAAAAQRGGGTLMAVDATAQVAAAPTPDNLAALLRALASVYRAYPDLFLDPNLQYDVFLQFMQEVGTGPALASSPSTFLGFLEVLTALAAGEKGARSMYDQLRGENAFPLVSWRRMFQLLGTVVRQYMPEDGAEAASGAGGGAAAPPGSLQQRTLSTVVLPACDSKALCAFVDLFSRVMREGRAEEALSWLRQLEDDAGVSPAWEVLFQAMCCPVPQELKASLDGAIAATACRADVAAALWERLLAAVVVAPAAAAGTAVPRYDLSYQLNEIEARAEDYSEALAFVRLLNALWRSGGGAALADGGRCTAHLTKFVREDLLSTLFQRAFRDEAQRWQLAAACFEHCQLCLEALPPTPAALAEEAASAAAPKLPGLDVMLDLLGERAALRAAAATATIEVDRLAHERHASPFGAAREGGVLAALRLLRAALDRDGDLVAALRRATHSASFETLDAVLRRDRRRLPLLLDTVRYPYNPAVQSEALRVAAHLSERIPGLVPLLLNSPPTAEVSAVQRLQDGFAAAMQASLFSQAASAALDAPSAADGDAGGDAGGGGGDPRAALVLRLLLDALERPPPNLSHLLCGFDADPATGLMYLPDPRGQYNVLRVLLTAIEAPGLPARKPALFEQCLELLYELAAAPDTGAATLDLLRGRYAMLAPLLGTVACAPLPAAAEQLPPSLHQRAWLLQLHALELHAADPALPQHAESLSNLLVALFGDDDALSAPEGVGNGSAAGAGGGQGQGRCCMLELLDLATAAAPAEPQLGRDAAPEVRRMIKALEIDSLLSAGTLAEQGGVRVLGPRGAPFFDLLALKDELLKRYNESVARHGTAPDALREASVQALQYAQLHNAYMEQLAGQAALLAAWQAVLLVAFTRRFEQLAAATGAASLTELVLQMLEECLRALQQLVSGPGLGLAPALCEAVQALLARLQEQAAAAGSEDPLAGVPLPARCHALLQALLEVTWQGRQLEAVRVPLYSALASYLAMCRGPPMLRAPPRVVAALLGGLPAGAAAAGQLDGVQGQLEEGNAVLLAAAEPVLELLAADALAQEPQQATAALTALCAVLAGDPSGAAAEALYRCALPSRLLGELREATGRALSLPPPQGQAALLVVEGQLALLLRLALAGPPAARASSAQRLFALHAIPKLGACKGLDLQPEEPGFGLRSGSASLRARLHHLVTPLLRVVLALLAALPSGAAAREQALAFVGDHSRTLLRVMHDAASPGVRGWEPGDAELEEAVLVVRLLAALAHWRHRLPSGPQLQEAAYRLVSRFLCLASKSPSPVVARLAAAREAGRLAPQDARSFLGVLSLRCALADYLLQLSSDPTHPTTFRVAMPAVGDAAAQHGATPMPTLLLIKDGLLQAVVEDMPEALEEEPLLLEGLSGGGGELQASPGCGGASSTAGAARTRAVRAAAAAGAQLDKLLYLTEHLLAVLYCHLRACLPAPLLGAASPDKGMLAYAANGGGGSEAHPTLATLGSERDLDQLRRLMEPVAAAAERVAARLGAGRDTSSLQLLVRRVKEYLSLL